MFKKTAKKLVESVKDEIKDNCKVQKALIIGGLIITHVLAFLLGTAFVQRRTVTNIYIRR